MTRPSAVALAALVLGAGIGQAEVVAPKGAPGPIAFGAQEVTNALKAKADARTRVFIAERGDPLLARVQRKRAGVPAAPESYRISIPGRDTIVVEGRDAAGAMYGALDVAEQIAWTHGGEIAGQIKAGARSPFLAVRGVNTFLTAQGFEDPGSWFWSDSFWHSYLDQLARTRHNFLDLHGPWDLTVEWPNGFPYFVWLPDFPDVGVGRAQAARNLAQFRHIIRMASDRGIRVGYMNYTAAAPIGSWKAGIFAAGQLFIPKRQRPPHAARFLEASRLEQYTREAAAAFLKALPELWMFGFRVGESGQPEDFYQKTYLEALKGVPRSLHVYTRTWLADPAKVRTLAASVRNRFFIEPKFNGEHLGLPYQAVLGGRYYAPSGSYEDYTNYPRNYSIIWQIRAHGTHRVFHWGWPEFARRTVRACKFGGGAGFSMEPPNAYCPETDYLHNNPQVDHNFCAWKHQRDWFWYLVWGRTAYDPEVSDRVWLAEFERRFGARAGRLVYQALVENSRIVPFVFSYHNQGLDHIHFAPEFETGDYPRATAAWQNQRIVPYQASLTNFLAYGALDRTAMADPVSYVEERLSGASSGRMTPYEAGEYLRAAADKSEALIQEAARLEPSSNKEFACIRMDIDAVAALGRYYRDRILSATHLAFYNHTKHRPELSAARELFTQAVRQWDRLADVADTHFGYVPELIRMRNYQFRWKDEGRSFAAIRGELDRMEADARKFSRPADDIGHVPPRTAHPGKAIEISATARTDRSLYLFYKRPGALRYTEVAMRIRNRAESTWEGRIPADAAVAGTLQYYFEARGGPGQSGYGGTLGHRPPYAVRVTDDHSKPRIAHRAPAVSPGAASVGVDVTVTGNAAIRKVLVYYKRMPSYYEWITVRMENAGGSVYRARLPLTPEGILYYFTATDENGNAVNDPDFLKRTPYFAINGR